MNRVPEVITTVQRRRRWSTEEKVAILVQDKGKLTSVLDILIEATRAGELDDHLARYA